MASNKTRRKKKKRRSRNGFYSFRPITIGLIGLSFCYFVILFLQSYHETIKISTTTTTTTAAAAESFPPPLHKQQHDTIKISTTTTTTKEESFSPPIPKQQHDTNSEATLEWYQKSQPILYEFPRITRRLEFIRHLEKLPQYKTGIEVGVQKGVLATKSLRIWKSATEYKLVDLWGKEEGYNEPGADTAADKDANLREAWGRLKDWEASGVVEFFVMRSTSAAKRFKDGYFDYIYLDARHDYCAVKEDIEHYYPKLRPGGILGGHDYIDAQYAIDRLGTVEDWSKCEDGSIHPEAVKGAVDEFRAKHSLDVYTSNEDFPSWYIQKPY